MSGPRVAMMLMSLASSLGGGLPPMFRGRRTRDRELRSAGESARMLSAADAKRERRAARNRRDLRAVTS